MINEKEQELLTTIAMSSEYLKNMLGHELESISNTIEHGDWKGSIKDEEVRKIWENYSMMTKQIERIIDDFLNKNLY